jgi:hypothetical protein
LALVLVIEPDSKQSGVVKRVLRERVGAECILADSKDAALVALRARIPDLILVSALLSPRDEADLSDHLRDLEDAEHLQTLTIPLLATGPAFETSGRKGGLLGKFKKQPATGGVRGCDPAVFADEIRAYLHRAAEVKTETAARRDLERREAARVKTQARAEANEGSASSEEAEQQTGVPGRTRKLVTRRAKIAHASESRSQPVQPERPERPVKPAKDPFDITGLSDPPRSIGGQRSDLEFDEAAPDRLEAESEEPQGHEIDPLRADGLSINSGEGTEATGGDPLETARSQGQDQNAGTYRESEQQAAARREEERREAERRLAAARLEMQRLEASRREEERLDAERLDTARREASRLEAERREAEERLAAARAEADRLAAARREDERLETERLEAARREAARREEERKEAERLEAARREAERVEAERQQAERQREAARLEIQRLELIRREAERLEAERREASQREAERLEAERREAARQEAARAEAELRLAARREAERLEAERLEAARREAARREEERLEAVRRESERLEALRLEVARQEAERLERQRVEAERLLEDARREAERVEAERLEAERLKAEAQRLKEEAKRLKAEERAARRAARQRPSEPTEHSSWIGRAIDALRTDIQRLHKHRAAAPEPAELARAQPTEPERPQVAKPSKKPQQPLPEQDEWGLYDPAQCGFDALYAKLEQADKQPAAQADENPESLESATAPVEDLADGGDWIDIPLSSLQPSQPLNQARGLSTPTKASSLAPLAMWAHADGGNTSGEDIPKPKDELVELIARLHLPSSVAAVSYPRGCRIRRVRVTPQNGSPRNSKSKSDEPLVILSRKRLQELREEAAESDLKLSDAHER